MSLQSQRYRNTGTSFAESVGCSHLKNFDASNGFSAGTVSAELSAYTDLETFRDAEKQTVLTISASVTTKALGSRFCHWECTVTCCRCLLDFFVTRDA